MAAFAGALLGGSGFAAPPHCTALREPLTEARWLSLPSSRLVINPFLGHFGSGNALEGVLAMRLAYYVGTAPVPLPAFWFLQPAGPSESTRGVTAGPRLPLSNAAQWQIAGARAAFGGESVSVTSDGSFGAISQTVMVDLDKTPYLCVQTPPGSPAFAMKVNSGDQPVDTLLEPRERLGAATADISAATGWHGVKTFQVRLFVFKSNSVTFTRVQFLGLSDSQNFSEENVWMPQAITSHARIGPAPGLVTGTVILPDSDSVSQRLLIGPAGPSALILAGQFAGAVHWDEAHRTLRLQGDGFSAALCVSRPAKWLGIRPTSLDWAVGSYGSRPALSGAWRLALSGLKPGDTIVIAARFAPSAGAMARVAEAVMPQASSDHFRAALRRNEADWNRRLAQVPRPGDFTPRSVDARGVLAADVRRSYYRAWVFLWEDTLPPMPENGFPYPQVCAGKPALWTDGAPHSEFTAVWDSAAAMQALALVEPDLTWNAAQGIMSQVGEDGYLAGEALPAAFAQTFWGLYRQTGDREKLLRVYPALKRYMVWKIAHPRWVYPNKSVADVRPSTQKDNEYVVHEILEMGYMINIGDALKLPGEAAFWRQQRRSAAADYLHWFLPPPGDTVYRLYASETNRIAPNEVWGVKALQLPADLLPRSARETLFSVFLRNFRVTWPFGITQNRFGDLEPITLGLFQSGQVREARQMADLALRDVTRAGEFSEFYTPEDPPKPGGVRPSSFGACLMIASVLWHNGVVLDQGFPVLLGMPGAVGVDNIPVRGLPLAVRFDNEAHTVTLNGPGLARLRLPPGFHALTQAKQIYWTGPIAEGQTLRL